MFRREAETLMLLDVAMVVGSFALALMGPPILAYLLPLLR